MQNICWFQLPRCEDLFYHSKLNCLGFVLLVGQNLTFKGITFGYKKLIQKIIGTFIDNANELLAAALILATFTTNVPKIQRLQLLKCEYSLVFFASYDCKVN